HHRGDVSARTGHLSSRSPRSSIRGRPSAICVTWIRSRSNRGGGLQGGRPWSCSPVVKPGCLSSLHKISRLPLFTIVSRARGHNGIRGGGLAKTANNAVRNVALGPRLCSPEDLREFRLCGLGAKSTFPDGRPGGR